MPNPNTHGGWIVLSVQRLGTVYLSTTPQIVLCSLRYYPTAFHNEGVLGVYDANQHGFNMHVACWGFMM